MQELLYLKDEQIKQFIEKLFVAYRESFSDTKNTLNKHSLGLAHHKAFHLISMYRGITISKLLKKYGTKMPASDIDAHIKHKDVDEIKKLCEEMYHGGKISRTANYRYFILSDEKKKQPKKSAAKTEEVDVEKELGKLKGLLDKGLITQEQYDAKSNELLGL